MFCTNCGKRIEEEAKVCPYCGKAVRPTKPEASKTAPASSGNTAKNNNAVSGGEKTVGVFDAMSAGNGGAAQNTAVPGGNSIPKAPQPPQPPVRDNVNSGEKTVGVFDSMAGAKQAPVNGMNTAPGNQGSTSSGNAWNGGAPSGGVPNNGMAGVAGNGAQNNAMSGAAGNGALNRGMSGTAGNGVPNNGMAGANGNVAPNGGMAGVPGNGMSNNGMAGGMQPAEDPSLKVQKSNKRSMIVVMIALIVLLLAAAVAGIIYISGNSSGDSGRASRDEDEEEEEEEEEKAEADPQVASLLASGDAAGAIDLILANIGKGEDAAVYADSLKEAVDTLQNESITEIQNLMDLDDYEEAAEKAAEIRSFWSERADALKDAGVDSEGLISGIDAYYLDIYEGKQAYYVATVESYLDGGDYERAADTANDAIIFWTDNRSSIEAAGVVGIDANIQELDDLAAQAVESGVADAVAQMQAKASACDEEGFSQAVNFLWSMVDGRDEYLTDDYIDEINDLYVRAYSELVGRTATNMMGDMTEEELLATREYVFDNFEACEYNAYLVEIYETCTSIAGLHVYDFSKVKFTDEHIFADSDSVYLTEADLEDLSWEECRAAFYEIHARHGITLVDPSVKDAFNGLSWYSEQYGIYDYHESGLNEVERANRDLIIEFMIGEGWF